VQTWSYRRGYKLIALNGQIWLPHKKNFEPLSLGESEHFDKIITMIIAEHHDTPIAGHPGASNTYDAVRREFYWVNMFNNIKFFVASCDKCQRAKADNQKPQGLLQPINNPERPFEMVHIDFITDLLEVDSHRYKVNAICIMVDHLTGYLHTVPCSKEIMGAGVG
jgi:hypothetical protein